MSERKKGGGLDYTPRAFPGARAPDGPAPDLEDKLAELGLVDRADAEPLADASAGVNPDVNPGTKKRPSLDYTPRAFPGARAPDGPAPDLEDRLVAMGLAERTRTPNARPDVRHDASDVPPQPPARRERPAAPPPAEPLHSRRERVTGPAQQARPPEPSQAPPATPSYRERDVVPSAPVFEPPPPPEPVRRREQVAPLEPIRRSERVLQPEPAAPRRTERAAPPPTPAAPLPTFTATPQPVYVVPAPGSVDAAANIQLEQTLTAVSPLPPVPPEAAPRPLPLAAEPVRLAPSRDLGAPTKAAPKPTRAARNAERLKSLPDKEERVRLSIRLVASVDEKLNDLAHLRGLDRNTAVSVAIVQDWVECFGLQTRQAGR